MMYGGFNELDLDLDFDVNPNDDGEGKAPDTVPSPGSASLNVEDKCMALFTSCEWTIVAQVTGPKGTTEINRSTAIQKPHTEPFVKRWTRQLIRSNKEKLRRLGVDVSATYMQWGGILEDLS